MPETEESNLPEGFEWAIVEIFGHRRHAGRAREEERFGAKMLRIDVPTIGLIQAEGQPAEVGGDAAGSGEALIWARSPRSHGATTPSTLGSRWSAIPTRPVAAMPLWPNSTLQKPKPSRR
ncbi:MAG: hypothetical protein E5X22_22805 [Mesorhizobium sp.]|nr:MAG: hypothetical protein EOQ76_07255 [Mesorhizobium sp.]TIR57658.1 MAG: hypothetical protein E5X22_22805 [Mesorhizobium sp.]